MTRHLLAAVLVLAALKKPKPVASKAPAWTPTPVPREAGELSPERLSGIWVGTLGDLSLVLTIVPSGTNRVECLLNVGSREPVAFGAIVGRSRGLEAGPLLGLGVRMGPVREEPGGTLCLPLVDDERHVRGTLTRMEPRDRR